MEATEKWLPLADVDIPFGSLSYAFANESVHATLHGARMLSLRFTGVVALRGEAECPGFDPLPTVLPMLAKGVTFPALIIRGSSWLKQFEHIYPGRRHFVLITSDDLLQVIANGEVAASWEPLESEPNPSFQRVASRPLK